jgi:peroxiredoxin
MNKKQNELIGSKAMEFTLEDQKSKPFTLSDFKGKKVLLSFHPLAWTPVCAKQMKSLEENKKNFTKVNTIAVGISVDTVPSKKAWAKVLGITHTRLLSDFWPHGAVAQLYNVFNAKEGVSGRANIIINEEQTISFMKNYPLWKVPNIKEILRILNMDENKL